jgi:hypothetical protein
VDEGGTVGEGTHRRADDVTLKAYIEQAINAETKRIDTVLGENAKALAHQAEEYERRLDALNHEQARITARDAEFVREKVYEGEIRSLGDKIDLNSRGLVKVESAVTVVEVRLAALTSSLLWMTRLVVGVVVTAILGALIALLIGSA